MCEPSRLFHEQQQFNVHLLYAILLRDEAAGSYRRLIEAVDFPSSEKERLKLINNDVGNSRRLWHESGRWAKLLRS